MVPKSPSSSSAAAAARQRHESVWRRGHPAARAAMVPPAIGAAVWSV